MRRPALHYLLWLVPPLAAAAAFSIAGDGALIWDDDGLAAQMPAFRTLADVVFPPAGIPQWSYSYFRPATILSYVVDARLFGTGTAGGPHLMNVAYHITATFGLWLLARALMRGLPNAELAALTATTLFAVHPIHVESVSWITGRSDMLATMFLLPALWLGQRWQERGSILSLLLAPVLLLVAICAKEVALAGLLLMPLLLIAPAMDGRRSRPRATMVLALFAAAVFAYFVLRQGAGTRSAALVLPEGALAWRALQAAAWYLINLVWPWPQSLFVTAEMLPSPALTAAVLLGAATIAAGLVWVAVRSRWRSAGPRLALLGVLWIGIALAPSLAVAVLNVSETPVAERYLYLPSVGASLLLGTLAGSLDVARWSQRRLLATTVIGIAGLLVLGAATYARGLLWHDEEALWRDAAAKADASGLPWNEIGKVLYERNSLAEARVAFREALRRELSPQTRAVAEYNLGTIAAVSGEFAEAERAFRAAMAAQGGYASAYHGLGRVFYERAAGADGVQRTDDERLALLDAADANQRNALAANPTFANAHLALARAAALRGDLARRAGRVESAIRNYREVPEHVMAAAKIERDIPSRPEVSELVGTAQGQLRILGAEMP